jgi:hypothetical protein
VLSKKANLYRLEQCAEMVEFSNDRDTWILARLICLEANTFWPYIASDGMQYKYCREVRYAPEVASERLELMC